MLFSLISRLVQLNKCTITACHTVFGIGRSFEIFYEISLIKAVNRVLLSFVFETNNESTFCKITFVAKASYLLQECSFLRIDKSGAYFRFEPLNGTKG